MIKINREKGEYVISGNKSEIIAEIGATIATLIEIVPKKERIDTATCIYKLITDESSPLWNNTGVTVGAIKRSIANAERRKGSFEDFIERRFNCGEV